MVNGKDMKCFSLSQKFLHEDIFPKYPYIFKKLQKECNAIYTRDVYTHVIEKRRAEIAKINKKSVYRKIQLDHNEDEQGQN